MNYFKKRVLTIEEKTQILKRKRNFVKIDTKEEL
jgi:hypothetical protein